MRIALIGYGNMGKEIEQCAQERDKHQVVSISYRNPSDPLDIDGIKEADVAIDFTANSIVLDTIKAVLDLNIPLVVGTTGWYDQLPQVEQLVKQHHGSLVYGQNFSIGANIFFSIVTHASSLVSNFDNYDVFGTETHHTGKVDSPSGTAHKLSQIILDNFTPKETLQTEKLDRQIQPSELHFASVRGGRSFGRHEIVFDSQADEIKLTHQAWSRRGFAEGAILAAEFANDHKGIHDFNTIFNQKVGQL